MTKKTNENLFDGLSDLGLKDFSGMAVYGPKEENHKVETNVKELNSMDYLFDRKIQCPVCQARTTVRAVKTSGIRIIKKDTDFMVHYQEPNPLFYDAWLCTSCGYAALSNRFNTLLDKQIKLIKDNIGSKWKFKRTYPEVYTADVAIEMHKLALLSAVVKMGKDSEKAMICLKLAWIFRLKDDNANEKKYLSQALQGFTAALETEAFPVAGMDEATLEYLIGEIYRRLGNTAEGLMWFSRVIVNKTAKQKIKEMARDQKDLIKISAG